MRVCTYLSSIVGYIRVLLKLRQNTQEMINHVIKKTLNTCFLKLRNRSLYVYTCSSKVPGLQACNCA